LPAASAAASSLPSHSRALALGNLGPDSSDSSSDSDSSGDSDDAANIVVVFNRRAAQRRKREPSTASSSSSAAASDPPSESEASLAAAQPRSPLPAPTEQPPPAAVASQLVPSAPQPGTNWQEGPEAAAASAQRAGPSRAVLPQVAARLLPSPPEPAARPLSVAVAPQVVPSAQQPGTIWQAGHVAAAASAQRAELPLGFSPPVLSLLPPPPAAVVRARSRVCPVDETLAAECAAASAQCAVLPPGHGRERRRVRRVGISSVLPVGASIPDRAANPFKPFKGKGAKHANRCAGPWASALRACPPPPITGAKRARAGLAGVPITHQESIATKAEREARALVALLPFGSASWILRDPDEAVRARPASETAERLVRVLTPFGVGSLKGAYSTYGRLLSWVAENRPGAGVVIGSHVSDWLEAFPPSQSTLDSMTWLRDWVGVDLPSRSAVMRPYRGPAPRSENHKLTLGLHALLGLEQLAASHASAFVRGQAAAWFLLMKTALRVEQSLHCVVNCFFSHTYRGVEYLMISMAIGREKNPNPASMRPRPRWGVVSGLLQGHAIVRELTAMLSVTSASKCLLPDTDSPSGDPSLATQWLLSPIEDPARVRASLHSLLVLTGLPPERASFYGGHSAKRFMISVSEKSPHLDSLDATEVGGFSGATAQSADLEPREEMLRQHTLRLSVLPAIYSGKVRVRSVLDRICSFESAVSDAIDRVAVDPSILPQEDGFEVFAV
jgi:hypothetical protein